MNPRSIGVFAILVTGGVVTGSFVLARSATRGLRRRDTTITETLRCDVNQPYQGFRVAQIRAGGNSLESYAKVPTCFAESDFRLTPYGAIIAAHDDELTGNCGAVRGSTPRIVAHCTMANGNHIAHLRDFLRLPLTEWFLDLKSTMSPNDEYVGKVVRAAIEEVRSAGRKQGAVLMLYRAPTEAIELVRANHIRAGMKGYPETIEGTKQLVLDAKANGFEMVCVNISVIDLELVRFANGLGVWLLAWEAGDERPTSSWREFAEAGLGGLITDSTKRAGKSIPDPLH